MSRSKVKGQGHKFTRRGCTKTSNISRRHHLIVDMHLFYRKLWSPERMAPPFAPARAVRRRAAAADILLTPPPPIITDRRAAAAAAADRMSTPAPFSWCVHVTLYTSYMLLDFCNAVYNEPSTLTKSSKNDAGVFCNSPWYSNETQRRKSKSFRGQFCENESWC